MKLKNYVLTGIAALSFGGAMLINQSNADASSWHYGALPKALRGTWYAQGSHNRSGESITKYFIDGFGSYSDTSSKIVNKWKYLGNHYYKLQYLEGAGSNSLHYFNRHHITMNTFWHSYYR